MELCLLFQPPLPKKGRGAVVTEEYKRVDILPGNLALIFLYHHNTILRTPLPDLQIPFR